MDDEETTTILDEDEDEEDTMDEESEESDDDDDVDTEESEDVWSRIIEAVKEYESVDTYEEQDYIEAVEDEFVRIVTIANDLAQDAAAKSIISYAKKLQRLEKHNTMDYEEALYIAMKHRRHLVKKLVNSRISMHEDTESGEGDDDDEEEEVDRHARTVF